MHYGSDHALATGSKPANGKTVHVARQAHQGLQANSPQEQQQKLLAAVKALQAVDQGGQQARSAGQAERLAAVEQLGSLENHHKGEPFAEGQQ